MENKTGNLGAENVPMGAGQAELFSVILSMLCSSLIHHWFTTRYAYFYFFGGTIALFIIEYLALCLPPLLIHTYLGDNVILAAVLLLSICFLMCSSTRILRVLRTSIFREFKVTILVGTCVVIAAVDCKKIFALQFVKTQTYGFSPMDLGTGLFVAVRALDSLRRDLRRTNAFRTERQITKQRSPLFNDKPPKRPTKQTHDEQQQKGFQVPRFLPLLLIGLARVAFVVFSGYYQDPTEYGTHWNFFITLALIELLVSLFHLIFRNDLAVPIVSVSVGLGYFVLLSTTDLETYLLGIETERVGFLDSNREGICSTFGYLFIFGLTYLVARFFMPAVVWDDTYTRHFEHPTLSFTLNRNLVVQTLVYMAALHQFGLPSRRIANLTYGLHIHTIVTVVILFMHVYMHRIGKRQSNASLSAQLPTLHTAISQHGAFFFITANLLTGFLNFSRSYIQTPELEFLSLLVYMFVLCISVKFLSIYR